MDTTNTKDTMDTIIRKLDALIRSNYLSLEVNYRDQNGHTPLHHLCLSPAMSVIPRVTALVRLGADPNLMDNNGQTPLHLAAGGYFQIIPTLIKFGANTEIENYDHLTPLARAVKIGMPICTATLIKFGARVENGRIDDQSLLGFSEKAVSNLTEDTPSEIQYNVREVHKVLLDHYYKDKDDNGEK